MASVNNHELSEAVRRVAAHGVQRIYDKDLYSILDTHAARVFMRASYPAAETREELDARWADLAAYRVANFYTQTLPLIRSQPR